MTLIAITVCLGYKNNELRYDLRPFCFNGLVDEGEKVGGHNYKVIGCLPVSNWL